MSKVREEGIMAVEARRGCGYRKVGGLYLVGAGLGASCDRLPLPIVPCATCGEEPRFHRSIARINPARLWGGHLVEPDARPCHDQMLLADDPICATPQMSYLMWVGTEYTPESFTYEAQTLGTVSKRISFLPDEFEPGANWVFLAYLHLIPPVGRSFSMIPAQRRGYKPGVFYAFRPQRVEKIITQSQAQSGEAEKLKAQGITPIVVPDDDPDHNPRAAKKINPSTEPGSTQREPVLDSSLNEDPNDVPDEDIL